MSFLGDPVMPGCLGLDALWQMLGFYLGWLGYPGKGRALGVGEIKFVEEIKPDKQLIQYKVNIKKSMSKKVSRLVMAISIIHQDKIIYHANDLKVGLFNEYKRVVITGYGIVSCIGNNKQEVLTSLKEVKSGISHCKEY